MAILIVDLLAYILITTQETSVSIKGLYFQQ